MLRALAARLVIPLCTLPPGLVFYVPQPAGGPARGPNLPDDGMERVWDAVYGRKDYSISILPPHNIIHAHFQPIGSTPTPITSGVTITCQALADSSGPAVDREVGGARPLRSNRRIPAAGGRGRSVARGGLLADRNALS